MNKNILVTLLVIGVVALALFIFMGGENAEAPQAQNQQEEQTSNINDEEEVSGETHTIVYTDDGYSPQDITIEAGDRVIFENSSSGNFWPASNDHPVHNDYSEFDSREPIGTSGNFSFTFERAGEWGYHDHLNPQFGGTITVQ